MTRSLRFSVIASVLAGTLAGGNAEAQRLRGGVRGLPPSGTGRLHNAAQGMCLDVAGWAAQGDSRVLLGECNDDPDLVWTFTRGGELRNSLNGTCLHVAGTDGQQGANVDVSRCESQDDQRWKLTPRGHGTFELRNVKRGLCLDVSGHAGRAGTRGDATLLWACDGSAEQLWSFEPYAVRPHPTQDPAAPPPPPAPPAAMDEAAFGALVLSVRGEAFSEAQVTVVEQAAASNYFRVAQVSGLIDTVAFSASKLRVLELCAPHIVDSEHVFTVFDAFAFSADKEQARQILRRNGF